MNSKGLKFREKIGGGDNFASKSLDREQVDRQAPSLAKKHSLRSISYETTCKFQQKAPERMKKKKKKSKTPHTPPPLSEGKSTSLSLPHKGSGSLWGFNNPLSGGPNLIPLEKNLHKRIKATLYQIKGAYTLKEKEWKGGAFVLKPHRVQ